jgi:hypothetical protein
VEKFNMKKAGQLMTGFFSVAGAALLFINLPHLKFTSKRTETPIKSMF